MYHTTTQTLGLTAIHASIYYERLVSAGFVEVQIALCGPHVPLQSLAWLYDTVFQLGDTVASD